MKRLIINTLITILLISTAFSMPPSPGNWNSAAQAFERQAINIPLLQCLSEIGKTYGYVFTVETAWEDNEPMNQEEAQLVKRPENKTSLKEELERIRQQAPNYVYIVNQADSKIIHIIDQRLFQQKGYGVEYVLTRLTFKGTASELLTTIQNRGAAVSSPTVMLSNETYDNYRLLVEVDGTNLIVRDALSRAIPVKNRGTILWVARTKLKQNETSCIRFYH